MSEIGEGIQIAIPGDVVVLKEEPPNPKRIYLQAFLGNRTTAFVLAFKERLKVSEETGVPGPNDSECLVYTGHVGVSFEGLKPVFGFNPMTGTEPAWRVLKNLTDRKASRPYPGKVTDDTEAFDMAAAQGLEVIRIEYVCSEELFNRIKSKFDQEKSGTHLYYSFPGGGGDCNCATWPFVISLPVPLIEGAINGQMKLYAAAMKKLPKIIYLGIMPES
jgi:hypothetical protein